MQFNYFASKRIGINLNHIEWYLINDSMTRLEFKMVSGQKFVMRNEDEISYFFNVVMLMEAEE